MLTSASSSPTDSFHLAPGEPTEPDAPVAVSESQSSIVVTTGSFNTSGSTLISYLSLNGKIRAQKDTLVVHVQSTPSEPELGGSGPNIVITTGHAEAVKVEQDGPVRAVIKVCFTYMSYTKHKFITFRLRVNILAADMAPFCPLQFDSIYLLARRLWEWYIFSFMMAINSKTSSKALCVYLGLFMTRKPNELQSGLHI